MPDPGPAPDLGGGGKIKPGKEGGGERSSTGIRYHFLKDFLKRLVAEGYPNSGNCPAPPAPGSVNSVLSDPKIGSPLGRPGERKHKGNKWFWLIFGNLGDPFWAPFWGHFWDHFWDPSFSEFN